MRSSILSSRGTLIGLVLLLACGGSGGSGGNDGGGGGNPEPTISVNAGGDVNGSFVADQYFEGGLTYANTETIDVSKLTGTVPPEIFNSERYSDAAPFTYTVPGLTAGKSYKVTLYFEESYVVDPGMRLFEVDINGTPVLKEFDIYTEAGGDKIAIEKSFTAAADSGGKIVISFVPGSKENAKICGITVAPAS